MKLKQFWTQGVILIQPLRGWQAHRDETPGFTWGYSHSTPIGVVLKREIISLTNPGKIPKITDSQYISKKRENDS